MGISIGSENFDLLVVMWGRLGMFHLRLFRGISRSREGLDAIHPPIEMGGLLAST